MRRPGYPLDRAGAYVFRSTGTAVSTDPTITLSEMDIRRHNETFAQPPSLVAQGRETGTHA